MNLTWKWKNCFALQFRGYCFSKNNVCFCSWKANCIFFLHVWRRGRRIYFWCCMYILCFGYGHLRQFANLWVGGVWWLYSSGVVLLCLWAFWCWYQIVCALDCFVMEMCMMMWFYWPSLFGIWWWQFASVQSSTYFLLFFQHFILIKE